MHPGGDQQRGDSTSHQLGKQEEFPAKHMLPHRTNQPVQHTADSDQDKDAADIVK